MTKGNTKSVLNHLKTKHPLIYDEFYAVQKDDAIITKAQRSITDFQVSNLMFVPKKCF